MSLPKLTHLNRQILRHRLLIFLLLLLTTLLVLPFVYEYFAHFMGVLIAFFSIILFAAIYILSGNREILTVSFFLATLTLTVIWFNTLIISSKLMIFGLCLEISFFTLTTYVLLTHVLTIKRVSADKIYGAISGYLLIGLIWAMVYTLIEQVVPGSFSYDPGLNKYFYHDVGYPFNFTRFIYYSFVTLTTLGYGDITPLTSPARILSGFEAIIGQLYIATLVARLVGLHIGHSISR
jgi:Ion channel